MAKRMTVRCVMVAAFVVGTGTAASRASTEMAKLTPGDAPEFGGGFGRSVAISGDTIAVGAATDGITGVHNLGAAYVFRRVGDAWIEDAKLVASTRFMGDTFGVAIAIDGDCIVVGVPTIGEVILGTARAHVFRYNGVDWLEEAILFPSISDVGSLFGLSVAVSGDTIVVAAKGSEFSIGRAFVFSHSGAGWSEVAVLSSDVPQLGDNFANSVTIDGDIIAVSALDFSDPGGVVGSAVVFRNNGSGWARDAQITGPKVLGFARDVAVSMDTLLLGTGGSAMVFRDIAGTWSEEATFPTFLGRIGEQTAIDGNRALVSAETDDDASPNDIFCQSGAAYSFRRFQGSWFQADKLVASDARCWQRLGSAVDTSGIYAVVGTVGGSAYVFDLSPRAPATSDWGLAALTCLLLVMGTIILRRRWQGEPWPQTK